MCRNRSYDCQWLAERASNPRVRDILLDMARTWTRLALEAEEWRRDNSPRSRLAKKGATPSEDYCSQSSSASRAPAGAWGFLNFSQSGDRPALYRAPRRFETIPSSPILQGC